MTWLFQKQLFSRELRIQLPMHVVRGDSQDGAIGNAPETAWRPKAARAFSIMSPSQACRGSRRGPPTCSLSAPLSLLCCPWQKRAARHFENQGQAMTSKGKKGPSSTSTLRASPGLPGRHFGLSTGVSGHLHRALRGWKELRCPFCYEERLSLKGSLAWKCTHGNRSAGVLWVEPGRPACSQPSPL